MSLPSFLFSLSLSLSLSLSPHAYSLTLCTGHIRHQYAMGVPQSTQIVTLKIWMNGHYKMY